MKLINANILYAKAAAFEMQALAYIQTLDPTEDHEKWAIWTAILNERTAFKHDVADAPAVDAVPVVRCKDCKYRQGNTCDYSAVWTRPNGYCQWGERRDDERPNQ